MTISMKNEALVDTFLGRRKQVVAVVDPYSTGCLVAQEIAKRGYLLICVYSEALTDVMKGHVVSITNEKLAIVLMRNILASYAFQSIRSLVYSPLVSENSNILLS